MLIVILNIIGLILILFSIYIIRKDFSSEKALIDDLNKVEESVKEYYDLTEEIIENFDEMIDNKLEMMNSDKNPKNNVQILNLDKNSGDNVIHEIKSNSYPTYINPNHKKILELQSIGLTENEIAKKLNKGIREIEIVLKIYGNKK